MRPLGDRGFTVLEVMIALGILSISLAGMTALQFSSMGASDLSRGMSGATRLAHDRLEQLRGTAYGAITSGGPENIADGAGNAVYRRSWVVTPDTPVNGAKTVTVTVAWNDRGARSVDLTTVISR